MNEQFGTIKLEKQPVLHTQVYDKVRHLLQTGHFKIGEKIPGSQKLAKILDTHDATVHIALQKLTREGWLNRVPKKGTYVAEGGQKLTCVGGYSGMSIKEAPFAHAVREMLKEELHKDGIEMDTWMDPRPMDQHGEPLQPLVKAAEQRRFQAFIATEVNGPIFQWQQKLPVPTAFLGAGPSQQNNVDYDMRQFFKISLGELARQGCRSVGFLSPILVALRADDTKGSVGQFDLLEHFTDIAGELGLTMKNDWMRVVRDPIQLMDRERYGYEQFLILWSQPEKPEGLLVFDDVVARGVLMAIQEKQVRVPEELKLAMSKNESIDLFCPMPATFVVASEREVARALIEQIQKQFRGESCERISLPFKLAAHTNL